MIRLFSISVLVMLSSANAQAACSALVDTSLGAGVAGQVQLSSGTGKLNKLMYCDGTNWLDFPGSRTATACSINGEIRNIGGELHYCNNSVLWRWDSSSLTNGTCSTSGTFRWSVGVGQLQFCNGTNWRILDHADSTPDPITSLSQTDVGWDTRFAITEPLSGFRGGTLTATIISAGCTAAVVNVCYDVNCAFPISGKYLSSSGSITVPTGAFVRAVVTTPAAANVTCSATYTVGSMSSGITATTATTDTSVAFMSSFNEVRSATQSTLFESNIVRTTGHSGVTINVSDSGVGGSPEFRICSDATCATEVEPWGATARFLPPGAYVQMRVTTGTGTTNLRRPSITGGTGNPGNWPVMTSTCPRTTTLASGASLTCTCPANYHLAQSAVVGTGNYRQTSDICAAAIHAGVMTTGTGGTITVNGNTSGGPAGTCASFAGTLANGITSGSGSSGSSMYFSPMPDQCN